MQYLNVRQSLIAAISDLLRFDVLEPGGGAVSIRLDSGNILMSSTGLAFRRWRVSTKDFIVLDPDGGIVEKTGGLGASGTPLHLAIYKHLPRAGAVVHAHAPFTTAFASLGVTLPSVINGLDTLGEVPCISADDTAIKTTVREGGSVPTIPEGIAQNPAPYTINAALADQVATLLKPRADELQYHGLGFLVYRHGLFAVGRHLEEAVDNAFRIEAGARTALYQAVLAIGLDKIARNPLFGTNVLTKD